MYQYRFVWWASQSPLLMPFVQETVRTNAVWLARKYEWNPRCLGHESIYSRSISRPTIEHVLYHW
jgi:hypothetical protein